MAEPSACQARRDVVLHLGNAAVPRKSQRIEILNANAGTMPAKRVATSRSTSSTRLRRRLPSAFAPASSDMADLRPPSSSRHARLRPPPRPRVCSLSRPEGTRIDRPSGARPIGRTIYALSRSVCVKTQRSRGSPTLKPPDPHTLTPSDFPTFTPRPRSGSPNLPTFPPDCRAPAAILPCGLVAAWLRSTA